MRVMTILGSPRRYGNTAQVLEMIERRLQEGGHAVDRANIWEFEIGHCRESHQCRFPESSACGVPDDAGAIFERMLDADVVLFASPVFCWGFPAPMKALIDRLYCLAGYHEGAAQAIRLDGKPLALVMTCGGPEEPNRDIMARVFANLVDFWGAKDAGLLIVAEADLPGAIGPDTEARAVQFAESLTGG